MKKIKLGVFAFLSLLLALTFTNVKALDLNSGDSIATKLGELGDGDSTLNLAAGTYTEDITIDKDVKIIGAEEGGSIIEGTITVAAGKKLTIRGVTIKSTDGEATIVTVEDGATLDISDSEIYFNDKSNVDFGDSTVGILANGNTTIDVTGTTINAKYGIWVKGSNNTLRVTGSDIHGYSAIDVSNGKVAARENSVTVKSSTLTGHNIYPANADNDYGTVVFGDQTESSLVIEENSIVTNATSNNKEDLILIGSEYTKSTSNTFIISNSTLDNTNANSVVFNLGEDTEASNTIMSTGNTIKGDVYPASEEILYVTLVLDDGSESGDVTFTIPKENANESMLEDNIKIEGYYKDDEYKEAFNLEEVLEENATIYVKASEVKADTVDAPNTLDNIGLYIGLGVVSLAALISVLVVVSRKKAYNK